MVGMGERAAEILSANPDRAGARLVQLVESEQRRYMPKPTYSEVIEIEYFDPVRVTDRPVS